MSDEEKKHQIIEMAAAATSTTTVDTIVAAPPLTLAESDRKSTDTVVAAPAKSLTRSPRTRALCQHLDDEKTLLPQQDSLFSHLSTPSRISRSSTHQHLFTPELHQDVSPLSPSALRIDKRVMMRPSKRGACNIMTIAAVIAIVVFLFAGYPLTIYLSRRLHEDDA
ncbi:hypothetical protein BC940DRAFT_312985 [Gongronella butleri]|nr:hypothetical protein BC940DRAFT_312985 [Gongronella butleri]